jgi:autotransporter-associated beta strand protein
VSVVLTTSGSTLTNNGGLIGTSISGASGAGGKGGDGVFVGSGGNGGHGVDFLGSGTLNNSGLIGGGNAGDAGVQTHAVAPNTGNGGNGGAGVVVNGVGNVSNASGGLIAGGNGGIGGAGFSFDGGNGGNGGDGVDLLGGGSLTNLSTILGGSGGVAGVGADSSGTNGSGGRGVVGAGLTIINGGVISGGLSGDGVTRANAIVFTGGTNTLELRAGSNITGNVVAFSSADTFRLGGAADSSLDVSSIGAAAKYSGFGHFEKTGTGTWTLTGSTSVLTSWTISAGTLAVSDNNSLGNAAAGLTFNGGTLQTSSAAPTIAIDRAIDLQAGGGTIETRADTILNGNISGAGSLTKTGISKLTLGGNNTYTGATVVSGGVLTVGAANAFSAASATTINTGGTVNLGGFTQTINAVTLAGGTLSNGVLTGAVTSTGGNLAGVGGGMSLTANGGTTLIGGINTYTGATTVNNGATLRGTGGNAFSATSAITIDTGGKVSLGGFAQTINAVTIAGGTLALGTLTGAVTSSGGVVGDLGGGMSLTANGGITGMNGTNTYLGATAVNSGATLRGLGINAFSAASVTTIDTGGTVNLGGFTQTLNIVSLTGGTLTNGSLTGAVTSAGGTLNGVGGSMSLTANSGTTTVSGTNTYTGTTTVRPGATLMGSGTNAFSAASATTIDSGGTVNLGGFAQTINAVTLAGGTLTNGALTGAVTSTGGTLAALGGIMSLTVDSGATHVAGTNTYSGATTVNGGILSVNGSVASAVTVNAGGTLGGNGTVGNTTINGGTLAPGNSIGTLTVSGSLTLTAASTYLVQTSGPSSDKTIVTGTANLAGKVVVDPLTRLSATTTYTILNAGTVSGTFSAAEFLTANSFASNARLSYVGNSVLLTLDPGRLSSNLPGNGNINQRNVATAVDDALTGSTMPAGFNPLFALSGQGLLNALTQLSGEAGTGSQQTTFNAMNQFTGVMTDPFIAGRDDGASAGGTAAGYADEEAAAYAQERKPSDALAAIYGKARPRLTTFERRWSVWAAGFGGSQTTGGNAVVGSNNTSSSLFGTAVGADYRFSPNTIAGFALAGGGTNFTVANNLGGGRSDLFQAGAFVRHNAGPVYLVGALAYGWQDITTDRTVTVAGVDRLRAEFKANAWTGRLESGYRIVTLGLGITPYAAGQFTRLELPNYAETAIAGVDTFALAYNSRSVTDTRSELGLRTDRSFAMRDSILTLRGRLAWAHDFNPDRSIAATFQTLPGASFVVNGAAQTPDSALVTTSAELKWLNGWSAAATFEGEFSDVTRSYAAKGVVRYAW